MNKREIVKMNRRVRTLQRQFWELGPVMRGSVVLIGTRNKQFNFSLNKDKKTHLIYLGEKQVALVKEYSDNYEKFLDIVKEMNMLNIKLIKEDAVK